MGKSKDSDQAAQQQQAPDTSAQDNFTAFQQMMQQQQAMLQPQGLSPQAQGRYDQMQQRMARQADMGAAYGAMGQQMQPDFMGLLGQLIADPKKMKQAQQSLNQNSYLMPVLAQLSGRPMGIMGSIGQQQGQNSYGSEMGG